MSKKKRRYERHKKKHPPASSTINTHHCCFIRRKWGYGYARAIRQMSYCQVPLQKDKLHKFIHDNMHEVPVPNEAAAEAAYEQLLYLEARGVLHDDDPLERRLMILAALFDCSAQETADGFRKQLSLVQSYKNRPL
ncbi:hypothetical protein IKF88_00640 [Candidatus Saccharibacteria bacterium]|nr:hypothetical protein [Candidatus Saccharibacteria bacterium]